MKNTIYKLGLCVFLIFGTSCSDFLEEKVFTEFDADEFVSTEEGIQAILVSAYGQSSPVIRERWHTYAAYPCDDEVEAGGGYRGRVVPFEEYTVDAANADLTDTWSQIYQAIRNCNSLLDYIDGVSTLPAEKVAAFKAEATFLRAWNYSELYDLWGPVPLVTSTLDLSFEYPKATDTEIRAFIEAEYRSAIDALPPTQSANGKATRGAARAMLGRFLMNTKQWEPAAAVLRDIITDPDRSYSLIDDVTTMFAHDNEGNSELIFVFENETLLSKNAIPAHNYPPGYQTNFRNWGAQLQLQRDFVATYHPNDQRALPWDPRGEFGPATKGWICYEYIDNAGNYVDLMDGPNAGNRFHPRAFKYTPSEDPTLVDDQFYSNDCIFMRYADVLLLRSEALAMIAGAATQEAVNLLNEVRTRAKVPTYDLTDFANLESFIDAMLDERGWEFVTEGHRRRDLIRQGRLITDAISRGKTNASADKVLFPIPLSEIDSNPLIE
jgi:hypothetical protein